MKSKALYIIYGVLISIFAGFCIGGSAFGVESSSETPFKVNVDSETMLSLTIGGTTNNTVSIDITPTGNGGTFKESDEISVTTKSNNQFGHTLIMSSSSQSLINTDGDGVIQGLDSSNLSGYSANNFPVDRWGYSLKSNDTYSNYFGIGSGTEIQNTLVSTTGTSSNIKFGTNIDAHVPSGTYETTIVFTITAKPESRLYLQDVMQWQRSFLGVNESIKAYDARDEKVYWVTRIQTDSNIPNAGADCTGTGARRICTQIWMTQNLDLDLSSEVTYNHYNTDLGWTNGDTTASFTPQSRTVTDLSDLEIDSNEVSYDPGNKYYYTADTEAELDTVYDSLSQCINAGHTRTECEHHHAGNYYNFYTSTAVGVNGNTNPLNISSEQHTYMPDSICPAGWRLPTMYNEDGSSSDYLFLLKQNSVIDDYIGLDTLPAADALNVLQSEPLWFIRSGYIDVSPYYTTSLDSGSYTSNAVISDNHTNIVRTLNYGYDSRTFIYPSYHNDLAGESRPVRCIARVAEPVYMQDITPATCPTEKTQVFDKRDGKPYYIQKITANGSTMCWMNSVLDLDGGTELYSDTSNVPDGYPSSEGVPFYQLPESNTENFDDPAAAGVYNSNSDTCGDNSPCYSYYTYAAATAGTNPSMGDATYDICPKGWRLPTKPEYLTLSDASHYSVVANDSWETLWTGMLYEGGNYYYSTNSVNAIAAYWTSSTYGSPYAFFAGSMITNPSLPTQLFVDDEGSPKEAGMAVRCILPISVPEPEPIIYMQDITPSTCPTTNTLVYDKRDGKPYYIKRIASGDYAMCWMNSVLDLDGGTKLYSETSNVPDGYSLADGTEYYQLPESDFNSLTDANTEAAVYNSNSRKCDGENPCYSYYNYVAAAAGNTPSRNEGKYDICPKGWKLPSRSEYASLVLPESNYHELADNTWKNIFPGILQNGVFSRYVSENSPVGMYWTSTPIGGYSVNIVMNAFIGQLYRYVLAVSEADVDHYSADDSTMQYGLSVRCAMLISGPESSFVDYIQDVTIDTCPTVPTSMIDYRDGEVYTIQKLADGNCWMLDNLRLEPKNVGLAMLANNTNASATSLEYLTGKKTGTTSDQYATSKITSFSDVSYYEYKSYSTPLIDASLKDTIPEEGYPGKIGVRYNYCAASAGSYCYSNIDEAGHPSTNATEDLCPSGWRLPTGGQRGEYDMLYKAYAENKDEFISALRLPLSGVYWYESESIAGFYLSSSNISSSEMNSLNVSTTGLMPYARAERQYGSSIRCIIGNPNIQPVPEPSVTVPHYIQDVTNSTCPATPTTVYDSRDNKPYSIQRLDDGHCWLLDNLNLDLVNIPLDTLKGRTNASDDTLEYLKGARSGTGEDRYAASAVSTITDVGSESLSHDTVDESFYTPLIYTEKSEIVPPDNSEASSLVGYPGKSGIYYNYCAATAGGFCFEDADSDLDFSLEVPTLEDICPYGWKIPYLHIRRLSEDDPTRNYDRGEVLDLTYAYSGNEQAIIDSLHVPFSGYITTGWWDGRPLRDFGDGGGFWGTDYTPMESDYASSDGFGRLFISSQSYYIQFDSRTVFYPVRCILK